MAKVINLKWLPLVLVLVAVLGGIVEAQKATGHQQPEQTSFAAEAVPGKALIWKPVKIPGDALQVLRRSLSRGSLHCLKIQGITPEQVPASWFVASVIHLNGSKETDIIAQPSDLAEGPSPNRCLFGAHAVPFWVLRNASGRYALLLSVYADGLEVLDSRTNGYRDIRILSLTAVTRTTLLFKFARNRYQLCEKHGAAHTTD